MTQQQTVFVVDDDELARDSVCALAESMGLPSRSFGSAEEFLECGRVGESGCLVTDIRMLGMSGLELQQRLNELENELPVIVITGYARIRTTVLAMQQGAVTLLEKPCNDEDLWNAIRQALTLDATRREDAARYEELRERLSSLTETEQAVLDCIVEGKPNKAIALQLDVSERTVENRRRSIFQKSGTKSVAELVRLVLLANNHAHN